MPERSNDTIEEQHDTIYVHKNSKYLYNLEIQQILLNPELTNSDKIILGFALTQNPSFNPTPGFLASSLGWKEQRVYRSLNRLGDAGFYSSIEQRNQDGTFAVRQHHFYSLPDLETHHLSKKTDGEKHPKNQDCPPKEESHELSTCQKKQMGENNPKNQDCPPKEESHESSTCQKRHTNSNKNRQEKNRQQQTSEQKSKPSKHEETEAVVVDSFFRKEEKKEQEQSKEPLTQEEKQEIHELVEEHKGHDCTDTLIAEDIVQTITSHRRRSQLSENHEKYVPYYEISTLRKACELVDELTPTYKSYAGMMFSKVLRLANGENLKTEKEKAQHHDLYEAQRERLQEKSFLAEWVGVQFNEYYAILPKADQIAAIDRIRQHSPELFKDPSRRKDLMFITEAALILKEAITDERFNPSQSYEEFKQKQETEGTANKARVKTMVHRIVQDEPTHRRSRPDVGEMARLDYLHQQIAAMS